MNISTRVALSALAIATVTLSGVADPVAAAVTPLTIQASGGTVRPDGGGSLPSVDVSYPSSTRPRTAAADFSLRSYDDSFPDAERCEPATAVVEIVGDHKTTMTLAATGSVCGRWASDEADPRIQDFTGRYLITDGPSRFVGDDGFVEIVLGDDWSYLFAIDT